MKNCLSIGFHALSFGPFVIWVFHVMTCFPFSWFRRSLHIHFSVHTKAISSSLKGLSSPPRWIVNIHQVLISCVWRKYHIYNVIYITSQQFHPILHTVYKKCYILASIMPKFLCNTQKQIWKLNWKLSCQVLLLI